MSSLFGSLSIALRALLAQQAGVQTTSNNIANVNTRGYSRQRAVLREEATVLFGRHQFGTGMSLEKVESIRDRILELRLHQETQQEGRLEAFLDAMRQAEALFNEAAGSGLEGDLSRFFDSLSQLSINPTSIPLRQNVLTAGRSLAEAFQRAYRGLTTLQAGQDRGVIQTVQEINRLTSEIATQNREVQARVGVGRDPADAGDHREVLIRQLSELVDVAVVDAGNGALTLTTADGTALVVGEKSISLGLSPDPATGFQRILVQGSDITATITAGKLGGLLEVRDRTLTAIRADLDTLAARLATSINATHRAGFDLNGVPGGDFFLPPPAGGSAANSLALAISDPRQIAASSDTSPGGNGNVNALRALREQPIVNGQKPLDFYAGVVFRIGNDISIASSEEEAQALILRQLENQRGAVSGVSLDEEALNLIRFQRAFEAAARVVTTVNELTATAIQLGRS